MNTPQLGRMAKLLEREEAALDWNQEIEFDLAGEVRMPRGGRDTPKRVPGSAFLSRALRDPWESTPSLT